MFAQRSILFAVLVIVTSCVYNEADGQQPAKRTFFGGHRYEYYPGNYTQTEAWALAWRKGGYAVVFNSMQEHATIVSAFNYRQIAPAWTGHAQSPDGWEPNAGWYTVNGSSTPPLWQLFNSDGPDDGKKRGWSGCPICGTNEDGAVIWHDNQGLLEDVGRGARGGVVVEFNR